MKYIKLFENYNLLKDIESVVFLICKKLNIKILSLSILSERDNGIVIDLGNSILKITYDISEVYFADKLKYIDSENLVKVYNVVNIISKNYGNFYIIHQEKLYTKINPIIKKFILFLHKSKLKFNIDNTTIDDLYDFFKNKLDLSKENLLSLFNKYKEVYDETKNY